MLTISTAPHISSKQNIPSIMKDVCIALIPAALVAILFFGIGAMKVIVSTVCACVLFEFLVTKYLMKTKNTTQDYSAVITGLLLAYNLPSNMPIWMILVGSFVAIVVAKMAYGGLGKNLFNPALVGRVFLFISFPMAMTSWPVPEWKDFFNVDATTAATTLNALKHIDAKTSATSLIATDNLPDYWQMFVGYTGGCIGEVSALALLLGMVYMLYKKVITWHIPVYYLGSVFVIMGIYYIFTGNPKYDPITQILSGGLMLGAIFMATDYVTSPMSKKGKIIFAIGCGVLTVIIRLYGAYPEGVSFAILIMNAFVPIIDRFSIPRVFGAKK